MIQRAIILAEALKLIGSTESPAKSNCTIFGEWYGMDAAPWCAIFVSYVLDKCTIKFPFKTETPKGFHRCESLHHAATVAGKITTNPLPADIVTFAFNGSNRSNHCGIVLYCPTDSNMFVSIEGNTSSDNDKNGGSVQCRIRPRSLVRSFIKSF